MSTQAKTIVLFDDIHGREDAFGEFNALLKQNPDILVVRASQFPDLNQAMQQAQRLAGDDPVNIMVADHGSPDGTMAWGNGHSYSDLFKALPEGTNAVTLQACYSGSAINHAQDLPPGVMLITASSGQSTADIYTFVSAMQEIPPGNINPIDYYLELLDNTKASNSVGLNRQYGGTTNASAIFPDTLIMGGMGTINLRVYLEGQPHISQAAIDKVAQRIDTHALSATFTEVSVEDILSKIQDRDFRLDGLTPDEQRVALALMAAQCEADGFFDVVKQGALVEPETKPIQPNVSNAPSRFDAFRPTIIGGDDKVMPKAFVPEAPEAPAVKDDAAPSKFDPFRRPAWTEPEEPATHAPQLSARDRALATLRGDGGQSDMRAFLALKGDVSLQTDDLRASAIAPAADTITDGLNMRMQGIDGQNFNTLLSNAGFEVPKNASFSGIIDDEPQGKNIARGERADPSLLGKI